MATLETNWTDAQTLYFHFNSADGASASLPMKRGFYSFAHAFKGVPGTQFYVPSEGESDGVWLVPGYKCAACAKTFFAATPQGLAHECSGHRGIISDSASMGA